MSDLDKLIREWNLPTSFICISIIVDVNTIHAFARRKYCSRVKSTSSLRSAWRVICVSNKQSNEPSTVDEHFKERVHSAGQSDNSTQIVGREWHVKIPLWFNWETYRDSSSRSIAECVRFFYNATDDIHHKQVRLKFVLKIISQKIWL